jgi:hypothetical protein
MTSPLAQVNLKSMALGATLALLALAWVSRAEAQEAPEEATPAAAPGGAVQATPPVEDEASGAAGQAPDASTAPPAAGGDAEAAQPPAEAVDGGDAAVDGGDAAETEEPSRFPHNHFGHRLQGGVGFIAGSGYQFEIAYGGDKCRTADGRQESVCHHRAPVFFDFLASFGATEGLEILLEFRLGLLEDVNFDDLGGEVTSRPMAAGIGLRYLVSPTNRFKFFIGALLDVDFTQGLQTDVYLRPIFGVQVEFVRWVGFFVQGSVNLSFVRYFGISLDGAGGFQFRFP